MNKVLKFYEVLVGIGWGVALLILSIIVLDREWSVQAALLLVLYAWLFVDRQLLRRRFESENNFHTKISTNSLPRKTKGPLGI
jgi:hypothetical protein